MSSFSGACPGSSFGSGKRVFCYYEGKRSPSEVDPCPCTHILYKNVQIDQQSRLKFTDRKYQEVEWTEPNFETHCYFLRPEIRCSNPERSQPTAIHSCVAGWRHYQWRRFQIYCFQERSTQQLHRVSELPLSGWSHSGEICQQLIFGAKTAFNISLHYLLNESTDKCLNVFFFILKIYNCHFDKFCT